MNRIARAVEPVTQARWPVVESAVIGLVSAGALAVIESIFGPVGLFVAGTILFMTLRLLGWWMGRRNSVAIFPTVHVIERKPGLIVLVSPGELDKIPAFGAIRFHYRGEHDEHDEPVLQYLWLLCSIKLEAEPGKPFQSSHQNARDLRQMYATKLSHVAIKEIQDVDNPAEVFNVAEHAYAEADRVGVAVSNVVADITGGTKSMSVGLAYAGLPRARDMQFMKPRAYTPDGRAITAEGSDPRLIDVSYVEQHHPFTAGRRA